MRFNILRAHFFSVKLGKPHVYFPDNVEKAQKSFCTAKLLSVNNDLIAFLNFQRGFEVVKTFLIFFNFLKWHSSYTQKQSDTIEMKGFSDLLSTNKSTA